MSLPAWLRENAAGVVLTLHIQPGAKTTTLAGQHGEALKIRLAAPPVDGRANAALIDFLAETLAVPRARVSLISGHSARAKRIRIEGLGAAEVAARLAAA